MKLNPISKSEAARYMGIRGEPDTASAALLNKAELMVRSRLTPKYVFRETAVSFGNDTVKLDCMRVPLTGKDIYRHLKDCTRAVILAATLSAEADKLIRQAKVNGMAEALAVDCICSAAVEQVCNRAEEEIFAQLRYPYRTWRYSPGYGDLPITLQKEFLLALNAHRRIGLTVSESYMLVPSKSVTAIIGISDKTISRGKKGCAVCNMRDRCAFVGSGGCAKNNTE